MNKAVLWNSSRH